VAATPSTMLELGTEAPDFQLTDVVSGRSLSLADFAEDEALLVVFWCNHCPYVKHIEEGFLDYAREYGPKGVAIAAISSNDVQKYPQDGPGPMQELAESKGYPFPYLHDATQEVAKAYRAACTPDLFLFDGDRRLAYRGRFDGSRPSTDTPVTGADLRAATEAVLAGKPVAEDQVPSMGCNIKWKVGNAPDYHG